MECAVRSTIAFLGQKTSLHAMLLHEKNNGQLIPAFEDGLETRRFLIWSTDFGLLRPVNRLTVRKGGKRRT